MFVLAINSLHYRRTMNSKGWLNQDNRGLLGHGKIYLSKGGNRRIVPDVEFSNNDFNWYDSSGVSRQLMETHLGRKWSLKFNLKETDKWGEEKSIEALMLSPLLLGEMGDIDWMGIPESVEFEKSFGLDCGAFISKNDPYIKVCLAGAVSALVAFTSPGKLLKSAAPYITTLHFATYIDNLFDNKKILSKQFTFEEMILIKEKLMEVLWGLRLPEEQNLKFDFPQIGYICRCLLKVREATLEAAASPAMCKRFFNDVENYLDAIALNVSAEWDEQKRSSGAGLHRRAQFSIRGADSGTPFTLSIQALNYGNNLPDQIFNSSLFQYYRGLATNHVILLNDILSFKKETMDNESFNTLIIGHHKEDVDFLDALKSCIDKVNELAGDLIVLGDFLLKIHKNNRELREAIYLIKAFVLGQFFWYKYALRYRQEINFDAVIYLDDDDPRDSSHHTPLLQ